MFGCQAISNIPHPAKNRQLAGIFVGMKGNVYHVYVLIETADVTFNERILHSDDTVRVNLQSAAATAEPMEEAKVSDYSSYINTSHYDHEDRLHYKVVNIRIYRGHIVADRKCYNAGAKHSSDYIYAEHLKGHKTTSESDIELIFKNQNNKLTSKLNSGKDQFDVGENIVSTSGSKTNKFVIGGAGDKRLGATGADSRELGTTARSPELLSSSKLNSTLNNKNDRSKNKLTTVSPSYHAGYNSAASSPSYHAGNNGAAQSRAILPSDRAGNNGLHPIEETVTSNEKGKNKRKP